MEPPKRIHESSQEMARFRFRHRKLLRDERHRLIVWEIRWCSARGGRRCRGGGRWGWDGCRRRRRWRMLLVFNLDVSDLHILVFTEKRNQEVMKMCENYWILLPIHVWGTFIMQLKCIFCPVRRLAVPSRQYSVVLSFFRVLTLT